MTDQREQSSQLTRLFTGCDASGISQEAQSGSTLEIVVIFTGVLDTLKALKTAAELAHNLSGQIRLLVLQVVPYTLPLERPSVSRGFDKQRFRTIAHQGAIDTHVEVCLCRDPEDALRALPPESLVVIGTHRCLWPKPEKALARKLQRKGHHVILAYRERKDA